MVAGTPIGQKAKGSISWRRVIYFKGVRFH
jgi:hypothetical protein